MNSIKGVQAKCLPHRTLNQVKGVIHSKELLRYSEERLQEGFAKEKVIKVQRMTKKIDGIIVPLPALILTFNLIKLPPFIKAAWLRLQVRPYIPAPRHCYHCQRFGHVLASCRSRLKGWTGVCSNCGQTAHGECDRPPYCINCGESHSSSSKNCERYIVEREIQSVRTKERIGFSEAREKVLAQFIRPGISYSSVLAKCKQQVSDLRKISGGDNPHNVNPRKQEALSIEDSRKEINSLVENKTNEKRSLVKRQRSSDDLIEPSSKVQVAGSTLGLSTVTSQHLSKNANTDESIPDEDESQMETTALLESIVQAEIHAPPHIREQVVPLTSADTGESAKVVPLGGLAGSPGALALHGSGEPSATPSSGGSDDVPSEVVSLADSGESAISDKHVETKSSTGPSTVKHNNQKKNKDDRNPNTPENKNNKGNRQRTRISLNKNTPHKVNIRKTGTGKASDP